MSLPPPCPLTATTCADAASARLLGVAELLAGRPAPAIAALAEAVRRDPAFGLALADLALARAELAAGGSGRVRADADGLALVERAEREAFAARRWERHHVEVLHLALRGHCDRATTLGREHLVEFPGDVVVRHVLDRCCGREGGARTAAPEPVGC